MKKLYEVEAVETGSSWSKTFHVVALSFDHAARRTLRHIKRHLVIVKPRVTNVSVVPGYLP